MEFIHIYEITTQHDVGGKTLRGGLIIIITQRGQVMTRQNYLSKIS